MKCDIRKLSMALLLALSLPVAAETPEQSCRWERLNMDGGGLIGNVIIDPADPNRIFCLSDKGGIHRSDDAGENWQMANGGFARETCYGVSDLLIDATDSNRLYAAVGNGGWAWKHWYPGAIFRSDDGGKSWRQLIRTGFSGEGTGKHFGDKLAQGGDKLYAATFASGLLVSDDTGDNWNKIGFNNHFLSGVRLHPQNPNHILVSARTLSLDGKRPGGLWESRDTGKNWKQLLDVPVLQFRHAPSDSRMIVAACGDEGVMLSRDDGRNWEKLPLHPQQDSVQFAAFQPGTPNRLWTVGGNGGERGLFYSDDFGKNWNWPVENPEKSLIFPRDWFMSDRAHAGFASMNGLQRIIFDPADPKRLYASDYFGVWRSDDGGTTFRAIPKGINSLCVYQITPSPDSPDTLYINNADIGILKSTDGGKNFRWPFPAANDGLINETSQLAMAPGDSDNLTATVTIDWRNPHWTDVFRSSDGGKNWSNISEGLPRRDGGLLTSVVILDRNGDEMFCSYSGSEKRPGAVYHTADGGKSWAPFGTGLPETANLFGSSWKMLPNLARLGDRIFAATWQGLYSCSLKDRKWELISSETFQGKNLLTLATVAARPQTLWVGTDDGVYLSDDGGRSFRKTTPDFMRECRAVAVDPAKPSNWFVAVAAPWWTSGENRPGIYYTTDDGQNFRRLSNMPGEGMAWRLAVDPHRPGNIYVGTNGLGAWRGILNSSLNEK